MHCISFRQNETHLCGFSWSFVASPFFFSFLLFILLSQCNSLSNWERIIIIKMKQEKKITKSIDRRINLISFFFFFCLLVSHNETNSLRIYVWTFLFWSKALQCELSRSPISITRNGLKLFRFTRIHRMKRSMHRNNNTLFFFSKLNMTPIHHHKIYQMCIEYKIKLNSSQSLWHLRNAKKQKKSKMFI